MRAHVMKYPIYVIFLFISVGDGTVKHDFSIHCLPSMLLSLAALRTER